VAQFASPHPTISSLIYKHRLETTAGGGSKQGYQTFCVFFLTMGGHSLVPQIINI
jgi:hypothetical protein